MCIILTLLNAKIVLIYFLPFEAKIPIMYDTM